MASKLEFVKYAADQMAGAGTITYRKMFGEYVLYCNGLFFAVICDSQLFVKVTEACKDLPPAHRLAPPYEGAKPYFLIEELADDKLLSEFVVKTCENLPKKGKS